MRLLGLLVVVAFGLIGGCSAPADFSARLDAVAVEVDAVRSAVGAALDDLEAMPPTPEADALIVKARAALAEYDRVRASVEQVRGSLASDDLGNIGEAVAPWLPPGARTPVLLGSVVLAAVWRWWRTRSDLKSLAASVVGLAKRSEPVVQAIQTHAGYLAALQTPGARAAIDRAQAKRGAST